MDIIYLCFFAFLAGFIDSVVGGGGLIQLPALLVFLLAAVAFYTFKKKGLGSFTRRGSRLRRKNYMRF